MFKTIKNANDAVETLLGLVYDVAVTGLECEAPTGASVEACREAAELLEAVNPELAEEFLTMANDIDAYFDNN